MVRSLIHKPIESLKKISERMQLRSLKLPNGGIDFTSNDYLGLSRSEELYSAIETRMHSLPRRNGSTGSRLLSGNSALAEEVESQLAEIFQSESALLFDSGYQANLAVLSTLPQRGDTIIIDELAHASLRDGCRLSTAEKWNFDHNDTIDLEKKLSKASGEKWVVIESIYSMDGDAAPLEEIVRISKQYNAHIILDEAHSTGVFGAKGSGMANEMSLRNEIDVVVYTFGKAMGVHGACVSTSSRVRNLLVNFSRPFIYTTAPSDHSVVSIGESFKFLQKNIDLQKALSEKINFFRDRAKHLATLRPSSSQIQVMIASGVENVSNIAGKLQSAGFDIRPILSPTVPLGEERLRICLHTYNTNEEIEKLINVLSSVEL